MTARELASMVEQMRTSQALFFRDRTPAYLRQSRDWERRVDRAVAEVLGGRQWLFPDDGQAGDPPAPECRGHGRGGPAECCPRAGEYNGFGSDGPLAFLCPKGCSCHH